MATRADSERRTPPLAAGLVLGFGLGMFVDGIVLHQLLQWHHLVAEYEPTATVAGSRRTPSGTASSTPRRGSSRWPV